MLTKRLFGNSARFGFALVCFAVAMAGCGNNPKETDSGESDGGEQTPSAKIEPAWESMDALLAAAPADGLATREIAWEDTGETLEILAPENATINLNSSASAFAMELPSGYTLLFMVGSRDMTQHRKALESWNDVETWLFADDELSVAKIDSHKTHDVAVNIPLKYASFWMELSELSGSDPLSKSEVAQIVKIARSLQAKEAYPEDLLKLAERLNIGVEPAGAADPSEVTGLTFSEHATHEQLALAVKFPNVESIVLDVSPTTGDDINPLLDCANLKSLTVKGGFSFADQRIDFDAAEWAVVGKLTGLTHLAVMKSESVAGLKQLANLKKLQSLELRNVTDASASSLANLADLPELKSLTIMGALKPATVNTFVPQLTQLEKLHLWGVNITDESLKPLAKLSNLKVLIFHTEYAPLELEKIKFTGEGLAILDNMPKLEELYFETLKLPSAAFDHIVKLPALRKIYLSSTTISDEDLMRLAEIKTLEEVQIGQGRNSNLSDGAYRNLNDSTPRIEVTFGKYSGF